MGELKLRAVVLGSPDSVLLFELFLDLEQERSLRDLRKLLFRSHFIP